MAGGRKSNARQNSTNKKSPFNTSTFNTINTTNTNNTNVNTINNSNNTNIYSTYTKEQLKTECRRRGQKTTGNKMELLQRLGQRMTNSNVITNSSNTTILKHKDISGAGAAAIIVNGGKQHNKKTQGMSRASVLRAAERQERENLVIWKQPIKTITFAALELFDLLYTYAKKLIYYQNRTLIVLISLSVLSYLIASEDNINYLLWCFYWVGLGILSSVGFGTGLHTFILYLGPHIAKVTMAAYHCNALNFPQPPYPDEIMCPNNPDLSNPPSVWSIMSKVRVEAMLWGAGTALGELPPYFMARAARLSGNDLDDEDELKEFQDLQRRQAEDPDSLTMVEKLKTTVEHLVRRVGFFGILAAASIPNPLFDLAGMTCGHFLIPFWTFFGATLIGKAVIKMHIQKLAVIIAFNEVLVDKFIHSIDMIPLIGTSLQDPIRNFFQAQKLRLHAGGGGKSSHDKEIIGNSDVNIIGWLFEKMVLTMILYFIVSIINSLAQVHHKKNCSRKVNNKKDKKCLD